MRAKDVMSTPAVTVMPETPVREAIEVLVRNGFNALPVIDRDGFLTGLVTEADLISLEAVDDPRVQIVPTPEQGPVPSRVADVMTTEVVALPEAAHCSWIAQVMLERGIKSVPIVDGERVIGIVTRRDLLRALVRSDEELRSEAQHILDEEIAVLGRFYCEVADGVAQLWGPDDRLARRLAARLVATVPGIMDVRHQDEGGNHGHYR